MRRERNVLFCISSVCVLVSLQLAQNYLSPEWRNRFLSTKIIFVNLCKEHEQAWVILKIILRSILSEVDTLFVTNLVN